MTNDKICSKCKTLKPLTEFARSSRNKSGRVSLCRPCDNERTRRWYYANREKSRERAKQWQLANPERMRELQRKYKRKYKKTPEEWARDRAARAARDAEEKRNRTELVQQRKTVRRTALIGRVFSLLTVIEYAGTSHRGFLLWACKCVCGKRRTAAGRDLRLGHVKSCGCRGLTPFTCTICGETKPEESFQVNHRNPSRRINQCTSCIKERNRLRRRADPERYATYRRKRYIEKGGREYSRLQRAKRRAAMRGVAVRDLTPAQWKTIQACYNYRCAYCGKKRPLTMDHVVPIAKGGHHTASNIVPACLSCNCAKQDRRPQVTYQPHLILG